MTGTGGSRALCGSKTPCAATRHLTCGLSERGYSDCGGPQVEVEKAIRMFNGFNLDNRELKVNLAKPREAQARRSGFDQRSWGKRG